VGSLPGSSAILLCDVLVVIGSEALMARPFLIGVGVLGPPAVGVAPLVGATGWRIH